MRRPAPPTIIAPIVHARTTKGALPPSDAVTSPSDAEGEGETKTCLYDMSKQENTSSMCDAQAE